MEEEKLKKITAALRQRQAIETMANSEKTPETASAAQELIESLRQPREKQVDLSPLFALASPNVAASLRASVQKPTAFSQDEQRLAKAAALEGEDEDRNIKLQKAIATLKGHGITEYQQRRLDQRERSLDRRERSEVRREKKDVWRREEKDELSDKQLESVTGFDNSIAELAEIAKMKESVNTGPMMYQAQRLREFAGGGMEPKFASISARSGQNLFSYIKGQSGAQYSDKELTKLKQNMPNVEDDDNTFKAKMATVQEIIANARGRFIRNVRVYQGKNVPDIKNEEVNDVDDILNLLGE